MTAVQPLPTDDAGRPLFELPDELAIDTDIARRVISGFIQGQLRAGGLRALRARACRAASTRASSPTSSPRRSGRTGCCACSCRTGRRRRRPGPTRSDRRGPRLRQRAGRHQPDGRRVLRPRRRRRRGWRGGARRLGCPPRQLHGAHADVGALRPVRGVRRPGGRDRQQDRVADRLHDALRRQRLRLQPDRRPVQEPGAAACRGDRRAARR